MGMFSRNHRLQGARDLGRSPVQGPAQGMVSPEIRPACSGHYPVGLSERMEHTTSLCNLFNCLTVLRVKELFLTSTLNLCCFSLCPLSPVLQPCIPLESMTSQVLAGCYETPPSLLFSGLITPDTSFPPDPSKPSLLQSCPSQQPPLLGQILQPLRWPGPPPPRNHLPLHALSAVLLEDLKQLGGSPRRPERC